MNEDLLKKAFKDIETRIALEVELFGVCNIDIHYNNKGHIQWIAFQEDKTFKYEK